MKIWHLKDALEVAQELKTDLNQGLTEEEAKIRLEKYGPNQIEEKGKRSPIFIFLSQFNDLIVIILIAAALISGFLLKEWLDASAILTILLLNAILGFIQEFRAEKALEALKKLTAPTAKVIREGKEKEISASELVPGDLVLLEAGDHVPADGRVVSSAACQVNEATLTGESQPVKKFSYKLKQRDLALGERGNMSFMGTTILSGRARIIITATGKNSEMGKIAELIQEEKEKTPLQIELKKVGQVLVILCLFISFTVFIAGLFHGYRAIEMFLVSVSLAVASIPEGLPAAITVALALGVQRMATKKAIVKRLHAVETLGSTSFICTDKTGTLTLNQMVARLIYYQNKLFEVKEGKIVEVSSGKSINPKEMEILLKIALLCNDSRRNTEGKIIGDPTEAALLSLAESFNYQKTLEEKLLPRINEIPFDSTRKMMITIHRKNDNYLILAKGAPEVILAKSKSKGNNLETFEGRRKIQLINDDLAKRGYRTLGLAYKEVPTLPEKITPETIEKELIFVGIIGLADPPRLEVPVALDACEKAQIKVAMITGDHRLTAEAIAKEIGLLNEKLVISGSELEKMSDKKLAQMVEEIAVYARVDPAHKVKILNALKERGHIVAMTGDGINDAPAVKLADIGVAMGIVGTDVTKEAADMVLVDDNFATIVKAIEEGRLIFENIKKFILFLLSCNFSEVATMFLAIISGLPLPLFPIQILWINLITDGVPALALGIDPPPPDLMARPPRKREEGIITKRDIKIIAWQGFLITLGALGTFIAALYWLHLPLPKARTIIFSSLVLAQLFHSFNFRGSTFLSLDIFKNKFLDAAFFASFLLQFALVSLPLSQPIFKIISLNFAEWLVVMVGAAIPFVLINASKSFFKPI